MFRLIVCVIFTVVAVNAGFHHKFHHHRHHVTYDMNGFKGHHSGMHGIYSADRQFSAPPPIYGPPHHHYHHQGHQHSPDFSSFPGHGPQCHSNHGGQFGPPPMMPFNPFAVPNFPFNSPNSFNMPGFNNPNQFGSSIPEHTLPSNYPFYNPSNVPSDLPADPLPTSSSTFDVNTPTPTPLDTNTAFIDQNSVQSSTTPNTDSNFGLFNLNADNQPQNGIPANSPNAFEGSTEATNLFTTDPKSDQNNDNNYNEAGAMEPNNNQADIDNQAFIPGVSEPEATTSSTQGNNGLMYDIDIRFGDSNDNRTNQKPSDTIK